MIRGIGTDIMDKKKLAPLMDHKTDAFFLKIFTQVERTEGFASEDPLRFFASRFAAKEAIFKSFEVAGNALHLGDLEVVRAAYGGTRVVLHGQAKALADQLGIDQIKLSLSDDKDYVIAYAMALGKGE